MTRKLDFALSSIAVKPGDRVLDVGGGWGAFTEYAGKRGVRVAISDDGQFVAFASQAGNLVAHRQHGHAGGEQQRRENRSDSSVSSFSENVCPAR